MAPYKSLIAGILLAILAISSATEVVKHDQHESVPTPKPEEKKEVHQPEQPKHEQPPVTPKAPEATPEPQPDKEPEADEVHVTEVHEEKHHTEHKEPHAHDVSTGRQFAPMYQPSPFNMFPQPSSFNMIRRQFGGGMELLGDIVMMGMIGLPILGLLTVGSSSIANFLGFGSSSSSSKSSSKRNKRSLKEKAAGAVEYAKNLWDVMEQLEKAFEKYDLYQAECRLRAVCEAHHKVPRMGAWGQTILDLMRKEKELESREILPVSRFLFSNYAEAAQAGTKGEDCARLYTGCPHHLSYYISAKEDEVENEVEVRM